MEDYEKKYKESEAKMCRFLKKYLGNMFSEDSEMYADIIDAFPEIAKTEDDKIKEELIGWFKDYPDQLWRNHWVKDVITWLEKQRDINPYTGTGFKYNGHTWGMCARDEGAEILVDGKIKAFVNADEIESVDEYIPRFKAGDKVYSTKEPRLTYDIIGIGTKNELGNVEYYVEIFIDGKAGIMDKEHNYHFIECQRMDEWAEFINETHYRWTNEDLEL